VKKVFFILLGWCSFVVADWNDDFDVHSKQLVQILPEFTGLYQAEYEEFLDIREELLSDAVLSKSIARAKDDDKFMVILAREGWIVKKRREQNTYENITWELSCLLDVRELIPPAYPLRIGDNYVILQKMGSFVFGDKKTKIPPAKYIRRVSTSHYWKALLTAYILGLGDLVGRNIGISPEGTIVFFDTESAFHYQKKARSVGGLKVALAFMAQALDWQQSRDPLQGSDLYEVEAFIQGLAGFEEKFLRYCQCREFPSPQENILYRVRQVQTFPLTVGKTFYDFYAFLEPGIMEGFDELSKLVSPILGRKAELGSLLVFLAREKRKFVISSRRQKHIHQWIIEYVGE